MDRRRLRDLWDRAQRGWPASFPLVQFPNAPLLVALGAWVVGRLTSGSAHDLARAVGTIALAIWAYEELARGSNWFRRLLGGGFLVYLALGLAETFSDV